MDKIKKVVAVLVAVVASIQTSMMICAENAIISQNEFDFRQAVSKAKIKEEVYENIQDGETTTVYIWLEDIDHNEVETKVKKEIGFGKDELDVHDKIDLNNIDESKYKRRVEQENTDKYISSKREIAKNMHAEKKASIDGIIINKDNIIYESQYAPLVIAELTVEEAETLAQSDEVLEIGYYSSEEESSEFNPQFNSGLYDDYNFNAVITKDKMLEFETCLSVSGISKIKKASGLTGKDVLIGAIDMVSFLTDETYLPEDRCFSNQNITVVLESDDIAHSTSAALMIAGNNGIANESKFYMLESAETAFHTEKEAYIRSMEYFISNNISLINISNGFPGDDNILLGKYTDYIISSYGLIIVKSAGGKEDDATEHIEDRYDYVTHPGASDNVITVGAYNNMLTESKTDDKMTSYSAYIDENLYEFVAEDGSVEYENACAKPDIVAPSDVLCGGTSIAAPFVTGVIALMLECRPSLANHPEVVKAILMASCHYKAEMYWDTDSEETMTQGITEKQGAGVVDPYLALCITKNGNYGYGIIQEGTSDFIKLTQPPYDASGLNVSISWLRNTNKIDDSYIYTYRNNLDLYVYKNESFVFDSGIEKPSETENCSSSELAYSLIDTSISNNDSGIEYELEIRYNNDDEDNSTEPVKYGYAWSTDTDVYSEIDEYEGLYFIRNVATNKYLSFDCDDGSVRLIDYKGHSYVDYEQIFVITSNQNGDYKIGSFLENYDTGIGMNGTSVIHSSSESVIAIEQTNEGYYTFMTDLEYLTSLGGIMWETKPEISPNECWILEKVNYRIGDANLTGVINEGDYNYLVNITQGYYTPTNSDWFLSDTNYDKVLNYADLDFYDDIIEE